MYVRIFDLDENMGETFRAECDLRECIPDDDAQYQDAIDYLSRCGRYYAGGGAAPLVLLMRADR